MSRPRRYTMRLAGRAVVGLLLLFGIAREAGAQWSVSAFLGNAWNQDGDLQVISPPDGTHVVISGVEYGDEPFKFPLYYGARVGRSLWPGGRIGLEGEFLHLKAITRPDQIVVVRGEMGNGPVDGRRPLYDVLHHFELSHGLNFLFANVVARVPLSDSGPSGASPRLIATARAGLGPTIPHVEGQFRGQEEYAYQLGGLGWQAAGGVELRLASWLLAMSEVKFTSTRQRVSIGGADVEGPFSSTHLVFGLAWESPSSR